MRAYLTPMKFGLLAVVWVLVAPTVVREAQALPPELLPNVVGNAALLIYLVYLAGWTFSQAMRRYRSRSQSDGHDDREPPRDFSRHEAAHAVVALTLGHHVSYARLRDDGSGLTHSRPPADASMADQIWVGMVIDAAGNLVDLQRQVYDKGSQSDWLQLIADAAALASLGQRPADYDGPLNAMSLIDAAAKTAAGIIQQEREWIEQVAAALIADNELTGQAITALRGNLTQ